MMLSFNKNFFCLTFKIFPLPKINCFFFKLIIFIRLLHIFDDISNIQNTGKAKNMYFHFQPSQPHLHNLGKSLKVEAL